VIVGPGPFRTDFLGRSILLAKKEMPEYAPGVFRTFRANNDGKQVGDPDKDVKVILKAVDVENPPLHLLLGACTCRSARALTLSPARRLQSSPIHRRVGGSSEGDRLRVKAPTDLKASPFEGG